MGFVNIWVTAPALASIELVDIEIHERVDVRSADDRSWGSENGSHSG